MIQFNTDQWLIINYPPGIGGKFLAASIFQFDRVAPWTDKKMSNPELADWYIRSLPQSLEENWGDREIDTPWILPGISRTWPEGENTSEQEFNEKLNLAASPLLMTAWTKNQIITDFWHKGYVPAWWSNANFVTIVLDDVELHKKLLFSKSHLFDEQTKTITCPQLAKKFNRQYRWENIESKDYFYENVVKNFHWYKTWNFSQPLGQFQIKLTELFDVNCVYNFLSSLDSITQQRPDRRYLETIHAAWLDATLKIL